MMFGLDLYEAGGELKLSRIVKPSFDDEDFDIYARKNVLLMVGEEFSTKFIGYLRKCITIGSTHC